MTREEDLGRYQMLWDCPACGTEKLLGLDHRHCPGCGSPQDPQRRYFPPEGEEIAAFDHPYTGADRVCSACDTPSGAAAAFCGGCGSPLEGAKAAKARADQVRAEGARFEADSAKKAKAEHKAAKDAAKRPAPPPRGGGAKKALLIIGAVLALLLILVIVNFAWTKDVALEVTGHRWARTIEVEVRAPTARHDWREDLPSGAYDVNCAREVRSHKKVQDGEECETKRKDLGDGTFKSVRECRPKYVKEPVYADKCRYTVDAWTQARTAELEGTSLAEAPRWPDPRITKPGHCTGCEREGARIERYEVRLRADDGTEHTCEVPHGKWTGFAVGSRWKAKTRMVGGLACGDLSPR